MQALSQKLTRKYVRFDCICSLSVLISFAVNVGFGLSGFSRLCSSLNHKQLVMYPNELINASFLYDRYIEQYERQAGIELSGCLDRSHALFDKSYIVHHYRYSSFNRGG
jgi:hypothetical protein